MDLLNVLSKEEAQRIMLLTDKAFKNAPSFRTDTELRILVLDNSKYSTPAAKYYKSLLEVNRLQIELTNLIFEYELQEQEVIIFENNILVGTNSITKAEVRKTEIEIGKIQFVLKNLKRDIEGRTSELLLWDKIVSDLEPVLIEQEIPLNNPDAHQKVFLLIKHIRQCIKTVQSEEKISELEMRELFVKLLSNADIVKQENLVSSVIKELSLSEKHFVNAQNILQVTFTEEELKLIEEMSLIKKSNSRLGTKVKE